MKYVILSLKAAMLVALSMAYLGEIDVVSQFPWPKYRNSFGFYFETLAAIAIFLLLLDFLQVVLIGIYRRRKRLTREDNFIVGIGQIYTILVYVGIFVGVLALFRVQLKELFTSLSIIFAGLAIISKDYISNMINGMIVTFSGHLSIGDNVKIGQHRGKITDITLQNIHLLNDDDDYIYIPNNLVFTTEVVNYTKRHVKRTSIDFEIDLKHLKTVEELEASLIETLKPFHDLIAEDSYYLRVFEVQKDVVNLKFQYILKEPNKELERIIRRKTVRRIVELISERNKMGIEP